MNPESLDMYLHPTKVIDSDNIEIREVAQKLTTTLRDPGEKGVALFYFVRDESSL
jgi:transglutaminase-like putative cysteine protease